MPNTLEDVKFSDCLQELGLGRNNLTTLNDVELPNRLRGLNIWNNEIESLAGVEISKLCNVFCSKELHRTMLT